MKKSNILRYSGNLAKQVTTVAAAATAEEEKRSDERTKLFTVSWRRRAPFFSPCRNAAAELWKTLLDSGYKSGSDVSALDYKELRATQSRFPHFRFSPTRIFQLPGGSYSWTRILKTTYGRSHSSPFPPMLEKGSILGRSY